VDAEGAAGTAARYAPQRDVYADAAASISGAPVEAFTFAFSGPGVAVSEPVPADVAARAARVRDAIAAGGTPALAADPAECVFCGYRVVGLCPGVARGVGLGTPASGIPSPGDASPPAHEAAPASGPPPADAQGQLSLFG
jgi:hypothetical protein